MTPKFETDRLILRVPELKDAPGLQKNINDWETVRNFSKGFPWPYPDNGAEFFIENVVTPNQDKTRWTWGLFLKNNPSELIGVIELFNDPEIKWNRGFWIARRFWNRGLMSEAVKPVVDYAFNELGFEKLVFANAKANVKSRRVKEKTGGKFIGMVEYEHVDPTFIETEVWELTKGSWLKN